MSKYKEFKQLNLPAIDEEVLAFWKTHNVFERSVTERSDAPQFVFYEGPPSANGMPGIHHVMARAIKDIFCRWQTINGKQVHRKAGWDTHGLPIELAVEKTLGIRKDDIGKTISIEDYNKACRTEVMKFQDKWEEVTRLMGYWVDMKNPYVTYHNSYIESVWWLLKNLYDKNLLYKGYTIQPYSPAAGTGLSSHELNQPGTYKSVKDTTVVAQFKVLKNEHASFLFSGSDVPVYFLAWTTTPWTLPSNTALAVGKKIKYRIVATINRYTNEKEHVIIADALLDKHFQTKTVFVGENHVEVMKNTTTSAFQKIQYLLDNNLITDKSKPFALSIGHCSGSELEGLRYEQLLPFEANTKDKIDGDAFKVVIGDFVSTEDGTGIVHIAPSFGADDFRTAKQNGLGTLTLVDKRGKFIDGVGEFSNEFVKEQYLTDAEKEEEKKKQGGEKYLSVDERICIKLKKENKAFKVEKYEHNYPHCWRTDKPVLYYPLDSWFVRTTAMKDRMVELNKTINWKPEATGTGRFGNWLENLQDWNLSRSRFWGIPLPIWRTEDATEEICIGSVQQLHDEVEKSIVKGFMKTNPLPAEITSENENTFDLHRPYVDEIILVSESGKPMKRELDLIDVWFDSGAMPYAQNHYPFSPLTPKGGTEKAEEQKKVFQWQTANPILYSVIKNNAKKNRENPTLAEAAMWDKLSNKKLSGYKFRRQHIIADVIADFVCLSKKLVVEIDGAYHSTEEQKTYDEARTSLLNQLGFKVIRFSNTEVEQDIQQVLNKIETELNQISIGVSKAPFGGLGAYPADFIAEGVDQTRGWFFTLHAIATMCFDSVAYKTVVSNGLVLDKNGNKMSKRLGNAVDPFETIAKYGADATRWYMISNADPWDNLKFDVSGIDEVRRKLFGTLYNTYGFFALYANIDGFVIDPSKQIPFEKRTELDQWILSKLNSLQTNVSKHLNDFDPTPATRAIEEFVDEHLSNWYVRLGRRRFWKGEMSEDKQSAYETLHQCLQTVSQLMSPFAPFFSEWLYKNLNPQQAENNSVHLTNLSSINTSMINTLLEERMQLAQDLCSLGLSLRKKVNIKVRQPLQKIMIPVLDEQFKTKIESITELIQSELNIKEIAFTELSSIRKKGKLNFKAVGQKQEGKFKEDFGKYFNEAAKLITAFDQSAFQNLLHEGSIALTMNDGKMLTLETNDLEITTEEMPGFEIASKADLTVALDITLTEELKQEGLARELVSCIQKYRKEQDFKVTDKIAVYIEKQDFIAPSVIHFKNYICAEILADIFDLSNALTNPITIDINDQPIKIIIQKIN